MSWGFANFILDEDGLLSGAPRIFGLSTDVLCPMHCYMSQTYEPDWEDLRHSYLSLRHTIRFHRDDWESGAGMPASLESLVRCLHSLLEGERDLSTGFSSLPDIAVVHVLPKHYVNQALLSIICDEANIRAQSESGLLYILILRALELKNSELLKSHTDFWKPDPNVETLNLELLKYLSWSDVSDEVPCVPDTHEGTLEDMVWIANEHSGPTTSIASCQESSSYLVNSYVHLLGREPTCAPQKGESIEIRELKFSKRIRLNIDAKAVWNFSTNTLDHSAIDHEITSHELHEEGNNDFYVLESINGHSDYGPLYSFWLHLEGWWKYPT